MKVHAVTRECWHTGEIPSFASFTYFMFAPTFLYRSRYPRYGTRGCLYSAA